MSVTFCCDSVDSCTERRALWFSSCVFKAATWARAAAGVRALLLPFSDGACPLRRGAEEEEEEDMASFEVLLDSVAWTDEDEDGKWYRAEGRGRPIGKAWPAACKDAVWSLDAVCGSCGTDERRVCVLRGTREVVQ